MEKKKVGIITWHRYHNYGAVLQAYSSQKAIDKLGYDAQLINCYYEKLVYSGVRGAFLLYEKNELTKDTPEFEKCRVKYKKHIKKRFDRFEEFINKHLKLSKIYSSCDELYTDCPKYDIYVSGGDQIWNVQEYDVNDAYFLGFTDSPNKIAFGCGVMNAKDKGFNLYAYKRNKQILMNKYKNIFLREKKAVELINGIINGEKAELILDTSFALEPDDYRRIIKKPKYSNYIFVYILNSIGEEDILGDVLEKIGKRYNCQVLLSTNKLPINSEHVKTLYGLGPAEWLGLIHNAKYVLTSSFHGLAFSIMFEKNFCAFKNDYRKESLVNSLGLNKYLLPALPDKDTYEFDSIDYSKVTMKLNELRKETLTKLKTALDSCE